MRICPVLALLFGDRVAMQYTPATGGEDYDGPSAGFEGRLYSPDGCDLCGIRGERSEATQLLKELLVENGCLCLPADLRDSDRGGERGLSKGTESDITEWTSYTHKNTHRVHHCDCLHRKQSFGGLPR